MKLLQKIEVELDIKDLINLFGLQAKIQDGQFWVYGKTLVATDEVDEVTQLGESDFLYDVSQRVYKYLKEELAIEGFKFDDGDVTLYEGEDVEVYVTLIYTK